MGDDEPHHNTSCSGSTSGASSSSPSLPPAVVTPLPPPPPPPFPSAGPIPTAIAFPQQQPPLQPQQQQQLLQQYQLHQLQQQQQRVFSFHLSSAAVASTPPSTPATLPLKHPLPLLSASPSPAPAFTSGGAAPADRHARDDYWSEGATFTLIQAWGDCYLELNRGNLKQKHWREVADAVNRRADATKAPKTDIQCKNRIDTLKKKYKLEKSKTVVGGPRKWTFFERLDELIGASKKPKKPMPVKARPAVPLLPAPAAISLPAKRSLEDADQGPQVHPPFGPASTNYCPSSAANQVTPNHTGRTPNHAITGSNHVVSAPYHTTIVPYNAGNSPNHVGNARNQFGSNTNHVASAVDATSKSKEGPDTEDSSPNGESAHLKRPKRKWPYADPMHDLAQAITKFGEVYERTEIARQQMSAEIEKQRMIFAKDLELQRLQFFTQTQLELAKLRAKFKRGQAEHDS